MATQSFARFARSAGLLVALPVFTSVPLWGSAPPRAEAKADLATAAPVVSLPAPVPALAPARAEVLTPAPAVAPSHLAKRGTQAILDVEEKLANLGYWTGPVDGVFDAQSAAALMAFQKVEGRPRSGKLTPQETEAVLAAERPLPLETGPAHVEVDISRQVLFVVDENGIVSKVLPVSTGNGRPFTVQGARDRAYTPRGRFSVYRKIEGVRHAPLGEIYFPNYIVGGIAIHGSPSVPATPASHGCVRVPMWSAKEMSRLTPTGMPVLVHDGGSFENDVAWLKQAARRPPANFDASVSLP